MRYNWNQLGIDLDLDLLYCIIEMYYQYFQLVYRHLRLQNSLVIEYVFLNGTIFTDIQFSKTYGSRTESYCRNF